MVKLSTVALGSSALLATASLVNAECPFLAAKNSINSMINGGNSFIDIHSLNNMDFNIQTKANFLKAVKDIDFDAVRADLKKLFVDSKDFWPADNGHYGPLMIRLAWHCAGSYRNSDGRGGCDGARQRFDPEQSWEDNTNLDKARTLLWPIKEKYGSGLSWGDLIILAGNTAIEDMGGPKIDFCAGRIDDPTGYDSVPLGPTKEQEVLYPCTDGDGDCQAPLGATTLGLIYVNPEGPMGNPIPEKSAPQIRDTFERMEMNDAETVALIGGGHAFGKCHGACPDGAGPDPKEDPENPWPGNCGTGKGADTFTSGFEGSWTTKPTSYDNEYFHNLLKYDWEVHTGPGGKNQWKPSSVDGETTPDIMMLTSDVSLLHDESYLSIVKTYANNATLFDHNFAEAWYKLTTRDMGPIERCADTKDKPKAREWQKPLPPPPTVLADFDKVKSFLVEKVINEDNKAYFGLLAFNCASNFRQTDYQGGCNGARIRFEDNKAYQQALQFLQPAKDFFGESLTWADLIVLAGNTFLELTGDFEKDKVPFMGGRSDAKDGDKYPDYIKNDFFRSSSVDEMKNKANIAGLTFSEYVALNALMEVQPNKMYGTTTPWILDNQIFKNLFDLEWTKDVETGKYHATTEKGDKLELNQITLNLKFDPDFRNIAMKFAQDNMLFVNQFNGGWSRLMFADLF